MLHQTFPTFFRGLMRNKLLASINISGLAMGFASCILIALYVLDELGYDSHHVNADRIYRVTTRFISKGSVDNIAVSTAPLASYLAETFPEVEASARFDRRGAGVVVKNGNEVYREEHAYSADPSIFKMFTYRFIEGDPNTALTGPDKVVLTKSQAEKYFGNDPATGKTLEVEGRTCMVTGVIEDLPRNSDMSFNMLLSITDPAEPDWFDFSYYVFVMFREESLKRADFLPAFATKLDAVTDEKINKPMQGEDPTLFASMYVQPLRGLHFDNTALYDTPKGNRNYIYIFACAAVLILLMACINYVNFSIVQSMERCREVGVRKVIGSSGAQLVTRYLSQSLLLTLCGAILALVLVYALLPFFNGVVGRAFSMSDLATTEMVVTMAAIVLITGVLAGSYPAVYGASANIVRALKGQVTSPGGIAVRKTFITIQFGISLGLIMATLVIYTQMNYIRQLDLGFRRDNVVAVTTPEDSAYFQQIAVFRTDLLSRAGLVNNVAIVGDGGMPGDPDDERRGSQRLVNESGEEEVRMINHTLVDSHYFPTLGINIKQGRNFQEGSVSDLQNAVLVNEALVNALGWKDPLSRTIGFGEEQKKIIGVVGNVHYKSLYDPIEPQVYVPHGNRIVNVMIALSDDAKDGVGQIADAWKKHFPEQPFVYRYLDETLDLQYRQERSAAKIATYFSIVTIMISALGMFGLSLLTAYQRRREIGIRKVVGAGFVDLARLFSIQYVVLLAVAIAIMTPLTWFLMQGWLQTFVRHASISIVSFAVAGVSLAFLTIACVMLSIRRIASAKCTELIRSGT